MSAEQENFESLRKLLALKRHEVPPPGYHEQFSSEVMARLRAGEHRQVDVWQDLGDEASWLQRMLGLFHAKPALAGAFGVLVCGALLTGLYLVQNPEPEVAAAAATSFGENLKTTLAPSALALSQPQPNAATSTNPMVNSSLNGVTAPTLFDRIGAGGSTVPVGFNPAGK